MPVFAMMKEIPEQYAFGNSEYDEESAYWKFRSLFSIADSMGPDRNMARVFDGDPNTGVVCTGYAHAFDYLKLRERKNVTAVDLLSGREMKRTLTRDCYVSIDLEPLGAVILKFKA